MDPNNENRLLPLSSIPIERVSFHRPSGLREKTPGIPDADAGSSLLNLLRLIGSHKWKLLAFVALSTAAAGYVSQKLDPLYESTALLRIERRQEGIVGQEAGQLTANDMDQIMATQMQIVVSDPVLRPVATKYNLLVREKQFKPNTPEEAKVLAAPVELKRLKVVRPPNTYLIQISYRASDPGLAASVANDIAASFMTHAFDSHNRAYGEVSDSMSSVLEQLRAKMDDSSAKLAAMEQQLNVVDPQQGSTMQSARLAQLNQEYIAAQAERLKKQSVLEAFEKHSTLAAAEVSGQSGSLDRALDRLDAARQQFASIKAIYGENNSEYRKAKQQIDELERQVAQLQSSSKEKLTVEYQQALNREQGLAELVQTAKGEVDGLNGKQLEFQQMKRDAENDKKLYEDLERRSAEVGINNRFQDSTIQVAARALPSAEKVFPNTTLNVAAAFVLSSGIGIFLMILLHALDGTVSDPEEAAMKLNVDVIGLLPQTRKIMSAAALASGEAPSRWSAERMGRFTEGIRLLRAAVGLAQLDRNIRTILFTSAEPGVGKSTTAANLALSFAQTGKRVLLIDADLRTPTVHRDFHVSNDRGVSDVLAGRLRWRDALIEVRPNLHVLPAGQSSLAAADAFAGGASEMFEQARQEFDLTLVDAPPLLGFAESHQLARVADGVIVVTKAKRTTGRAVANTLATLHRARANVLGLVITHVRFRSGDYSYGYNYGKNTGLVTVASEMRVADKN